MKAAEYQTIIATHEETVRAKQSDYAKALAEAPAWAPKGKEWPHRVRVSADGGLLLHVEHRSLTPEEALDLGRWLVETFGTTATQDDATIQAEHYETFEGVKT
jgi:hypothetical protein